MSSEVKQLRKAQKLLLVRVVDSDYPSTHKAGDVFRVGEPWALDSGTVIFKADAPLAGIRWNHPEDLPQRERRLVVRQGETTRKTLQTLSPDDIEASGIRETSQGRAHALPAAAWKQRITECYGVDAWDADLAVDLTWLLFRALRTITPTRSDPQSETSFRDTVNRHVASLTPEDLQRMANNMY